MGPELLVLAVLLAIPVALMNRKKGKITLGPGKGKVKVYTGWRPRKAKIKFMKHVPIPGCCQLKDKAKVHRLVCDGFIIKYDIQSGPRTIKWKARKACKKWWKKATE
jgi:hypothetical protein